jgi:hypothetical protein
MLAQCRKFEFCLTIENKSSLLLLVLLIQFLNSVTTRDILVDHQDNPIHSRLLRKSVPNFQPENDRISRVIDRGNDDSVVLTRFQPNIGSPTRSSPTLSFLDEASDFLSTLYKSTYLRKRT